MFGLFRRTRARAGSQGRASLRLEALEWRDQPSANPSLVGFMQEQLSPGVFLVSGVVVDASPGNLTVSFGASGGSIASGQTTTTKADGSFSDVLQLGNGATSGTLYAGTVDGQGLGSQAVQVALTATNYTAPTPSANTAPAIVGFTEQALGKGQYLITGKVVDTNPGNMTVTFGGQTSASGTAVTTKSDGTFSCTIQLRVDGTDCGYLTATTTDGQNLTSQSVQVYLNPTQ
jgi:hypothetical protein